jgi:hypothetical protein
VWAFDERLFVFMSNIKDVCKLCQVLTSKFHICFKIFFWDFHRSRFGKCVASNKHGSTGTAGRVSQPDSAYSLYLLN